LVFLSTGGGDAGGRCWLLKGEEGKITNMLRVVAAASAREGRN
jgi:hypothetical protein